MSKAGLLKRRTRNNDRQSNFGFRCFFVLILVLIWISLTLLAFSVLENHLGSEEGIRSFIRNRTLPQHKIKPKNRHIVEKSTAPKTAAKINLPSGATFGHEIPDEEPLYLFPLPHGVEEGHKYRYQSNGVFWEDKEDPLYNAYRKVVMNHSYKKDFRLAPGVEKYQQRLANEMKVAGITVGTLVVPEAMRAYQREISGRLRDSGLEGVAKIFDNSYAFTLEQTTFPLSDGTTYIITGDIELMWLRDSSAQVNPYIPLLGKSDYLQHLVEGLLRRQTMFIKLDPYATSFRLFLDFDFHNKHALTKWDFESGRTIHVAMHNFELDNLAYHLRLAYRLFEFYKTSGKPMLALDDTWIQGVDLILDTCRREQQHSNSKYRYPELPDHGKGSKVCDGEGLIWVGFRPSDDQTKLGYLIPSNQMMVVSLRQTAEILHFMKDNERASECEDMAQSIEYGIHKHGVVEHKDFGKIYAYEVDGCGSHNLMDDANVPSLLAIPYLEYESTVHDPDHQLRDNTRKFVWSSANPSFYSGTDKKGCTNEGIGSVHTGGSRIWHMSLILRGLTAQSDRELRQVMDILVGTATNDLMHESFTPTNPSHLTRQSFAWVNSLFGELVTTKIDDILRVFNDDSLSGLRNC